MAARFFINGGVNNNYGSTTNWSLTSGGAGGQSVPSNPDDVTFDSNSPNCTIDTSIRVAGTLTFAAGYTGTITMTQKLNVLSTVTFNRVVSFAGASTLGFAGGPITTNGFNVSANTDFGIANGNPTNTLNDNFNTTGTVNLTGVGVNGGTVNGFSIICNGSLTVTSPSTKGTTNIVLAGTGTWSGAGGLQNNLTINTAGTITVSGTVRFCTGNLTYTAGTVVTTGSQLSLGNALVAANAVTLNTAGITWNIINFGLSGVSTTLACTINSLLSFTGLSGPNSLYSAVTLLGTSGFSTTGTFTINLVDSFVLKSGNTYTAASLTNLATVARPTAVTVSTPGAKAFLTITSGAGNAIYNTNMTDIDASGGVITTLYRGTNTNCNNVQTMILDGVHFSSF